MKGASTAIEAREVHAALEGFFLEGRVALPSRAQGIVLFAHGSGSSRFSPRNQWVARALEQAGLATLLFDLLTSEEAANRDRVFDIALLADRLAAAAGWARLQPDLAGLPIGFFGASTGAAAALWAAAELGERIAAVVSRGGRPDLAGPRLGLVSAPTLLVVGGNDPVVLELNREAMRQLRCPDELSIVPDAGHLFEEAGALDALARLAAGWFRKHVARPAAT